MTVERAPLNDMSRNQECWCGSGHKYKKCHQEIDDLISRYAAKGYATPPRSLLKTPSQIQGIRESSKLNIGILDFISGHMKAGVSTQELDQLVSQKTKELGGIPAPLNYKGYPKSVCISINNVVCHGIPSGRDILQDGDIVNVDVSTLYNGFFSDSSRMFLIGRVSADKQKLVTVAKECVELGIQQVRPWSFLGNIGHAVKTHARKNGYSVVKDIGGHGIGLQFHEDPWVSYVTRAKTGMVLAPGLVFTIEPMINMGTAKVVVDKQDNWTVSTADGKPSAQWESMVLVTPDGCEVLTY
ncbi:MAG: methionyl aminopeptidase [Peptococcaceae bacterium]|nr:methionyl aminopeptidase [Peptococcaceae bacterium]